MRILCEQRTPTLNFVRNGTVLYHLAVLYYVMSRFTFDKTSNTSLTLTDIAPKWADRFNQLPVPILSLKGIQWGLELTAAEGCLVGEAYGFSSSYLQTCKTCEMIGSNFQTTFITRSYENLKKNKEKFVKHWNEKHRLITEGLKRKIKLVA